MAKYVIEDTTLTNIASAIREKTGKSDLLLPSQMPSEIQSISGGGEDFEINDASYLFYYGARLECVDLFLSKFKNVNNMRYCFCEGIKNVDKETLDLSNIDMSNVTDFSHCFEVINKTNPKYLKYILLPDNLVSCNNFASMFSGLRIHNLDLSNIKTSQKIDINNMFAQSYVYGKLLLPKIKISSLSNCFNSFKPSVSVDSDDVYDLDLSNLDFSECTTLSSAFVGCYAETIIHENFDCSKVNTLSNMFRSNRYIINMCPLINLGKGYTQKSANYNSYKLDLSSCVNLTHDSLLGIINGLYDLNLTYDVAGGGTLYTQQLVLGTTNLAKLTEDEIAIGTNKGWVIS